MNLDDLLNEMSEKIKNRDLSDEYLREHNNSTREEIGIEEYAYGITMIPCEWVYEYLSDYKRVLKENEELKNEIMEKELEIVGKEEYTKASMGEIIEQYYTANEDCITKQKIEKLIEELKQDDINMTRKYKEKNNITGELLGIDKVRVRAYREKTREINEKLHKLLIETKGK